VLHAPQRDANGVIYCLDITLQLDTFTRLWNIRGQSEEAQYYYTISDRKTL